VLGIVPANGEDSHNDKSKIQMYSTISNILNTLPILIGVVGLNKVSLHSRMEMFSNAGLYEKGIQLPDKSPTTGNSLCVR
jgi:hypothetical protein